MRPDGRSPLGSPALDVPLGSCRCTVTLLLRRHASRLADKRANDSSSLKLYFSGYDTPDLNSGPTQYITLVDATAMRLASFRDCLAI
jgi:hypothetical protein